MKNLSKVLIVVAAIVTLVAIISRFATVPAAGLGPRSMATLAGLLLLFVIALESAK